MKTYRRFIERNDDESDSWSWWLQVDGNELQQDLLALLLHGWPDNEDDHGRLIYDLTSDVLDEHDVDILIRYIESDSDFPAHSKLSGRMATPGQHMNSSDLYRGGISELFEPQSE